MAGWLDILPNPLRSGFFEKRRERGEREKKTDRERKRVTMRDKE